MATTYQEHTGDGSDLVFIYPFPVLKTEDVKVALNGGLQAATKYTVSLSPAQITFNNTSIDNTVQENTGAPKSGVKVRVFRNTEVDNPKGVFAAGSSIRAADLNNNVDQALYALQEEKDQPLWDVDFEGGTINGVTIGATTPATGRFTSLELTTDSQFQVSGNLIIGDSIDDDTVGFLAKCSSLIPAGSDANGTNYSTSSLGDSTNKWKNLYIHDTAEIKDLTVLGDVDLGNAATDSITPTGRFDAHIIPLTDGNIDLGADGVEFNDLYIDGTANIDSLVADTADINGGNIDDTTIGATTAAAGTFTTGTLDRIILTQNPGRIHSNTSDASDDKGVWICGGGDTATSRGGLLALYGNEASSDPGDVFIRSGATTDGKITFSAGSSTTLGLTIDKDGKAVIPTADINGGNIDGTTIGSTTPAAGSFTDVILTSLLPKITTNTSDGDDDKVLLLCGGGDNDKDRGALIGLYGNEANANSGEVLIYSGTASTGKIVLAAGPSTTIGLTVDQDGKAVIPTADINGGAIDGTTIGGTTAAAGTFTDLTASNLDDTIIGATTAAAGTFTEVNLLDDQKIKLGSNGETEIYYDGSNLTVKTDHNQEFMVDNIVRFMINDGNDSVQTSWPIVPMQDGEHDLGATNLEWRDLYIDGTAYLDAVDINDGNIDGTIIGANSAAAGTFTTGTITTADINGGNIDGTTIGATTRAEGSFTKLIIDDGTSNPNKIVANTSDGSDNQELFISGGGDILASRGSQLHLYGNEHTQAGKVSIASGTTSTGKVEIYAGPDGTLGLTVNKDGDVDIANHLTLPDDKKIKLGTDSTDYSEIYFTGNSLTLKSDDDIIIDADDALDIKSDSTQNFYVGDTIRFQLHSTAEQINANWPIIPGADDTYDLGSESTQWKDIYIDGTAYLDSVDIDSGSIDGTTIGANTSVAGTFTTLKLSTTVGQISADTDDGSDIKNLHLCGGGGTSNARGATISLSGNEATNEGNLYLYSGAVTTGEVFIYAGDSSTLGLKVNQHGNVVIPEDLTVQGTLNVTGTTTTINTSTLEVEDKNITLAKVSTPTDTTADGGGITIKGATDKTFNWVDATDAFTSSEHIHLNADNRKLLFGDDDDGEIWYNENTFYIDSDKGVVVETGNASFSVTNNGAFKFGYSFLGGLIDDDWLPYQDDTHNLGSSSLQWKDLYIDGVAYLDEVSLDDNQKIKLGSTADDFDIYFTDASSGQAYIETGSRPINLKSGAGVVNIYAGSDPLASFHTTSGISFYRTCQPDEDNHLDLGSSDYEWKDLYIDGVAYIDEIRLDNDQKIKFGTSADLEIFSDGSNNNIKAINGHLNVYLGDNKSFSVGNSDFSEDIFRATENGGVKLFYAGATDPKFETTSTGATLRGNLAINNSTQSKIVLDTSDGSDSKWLNINGGGDASQSRGGGIMLGGNEYSSNEGRVWLLAGDSGSANGTIDFSTGGSLRARLTHDGHFTIPNGTGKIKLGSSGDLSIYHDGNNSKITDGGTGVLAIGGSGVYIESADHSETFAKFNDSGNGEVKLYYDGSTNPKFETHADGIHVTGDVSITGHYLADDDEKLKMGDAGDLQIWHGESNSGTDENTNYISSASGRNLVLQVHDDNDGIILHKRTGTGLLNFEVLASFVAGGANTFYHNGSKRCETTSSGFSVPGGYYLEVPHNSGKLTLGDGPDLEIFHDGTESWVKNVTGDLRLCNTNGNGNEVKIGAREDQDSIIVYPLAQTEIHHNGQKKFHTHSGGVTITGYIQMDGTEGSAAAGNIYIEDNGKLVFGGQPDLQIYHDEDNSYIKDTGTGDLNISGSIVRLQSSGGNTLARGVTDGTFELYHNNLLKLSTTQNGIDVSGQAQIDGNCFPYSDDNSDLGLSSNRWDNIYATNGTIQTSDKNEKNTIVESDLGLNFVNKLKPVSYKWNKDDSKTHYGLIAQDVEETLSTEGKTDQDFAALNIPTDGPIGLNYSELISPLIKAIQELSAEVETLKTKVAALEGG